MQWSLTWSARCLQQANNAHYHKVALWEALSHELLLYWIEEVGKEGACEWSVESTPLDGQVPLHPKPPLCLGVK